MRRFCFGNRPARCRNDQSRLKAVLLSFERIPLKSSANVKLPFSLRWLPPDRQRKEVRLQYRFLDLRNQKCTGTLYCVRRSFPSLRAKCRSSGFLEIQTPILFTSSPEGTRYHDSEPTASRQVLCAPQAPQIFKQLLMVSGFDCYFQIAPCFRDEDAPGGPFPGEFYQLDFEMAFCVPRRCFCRRGDGTFLPCSGTSLIKP